MKEELQCAQCEKIWTRERIKGRKPFTCPECTAINIKENVKFVGKKIPINESDKNSIKKYNFYVPGRSVWYCENCTEIIEIHVGVTENPSHWCPKQKGALSPLMQRISPKTRAKTIIPV